MDKLFCKFKPSNGYVIAETACGHEGDPEKLRMLIDCVVKSKSRIIKFQIFKTHERAIEGHKEWEIFHRLELNKSDWLAQVTYAKNKVLYIFADVYGDDSFSLAEKISAYCEGQNRKQGVLLQVNVSGEEAKFGMTPSELEEQLPSFGQLQGILVQGLMTIPPQDSDAENSRQYFSALRELRDKYRAMNIEGVELNELSMGMTNDYPIAVEEGATFVRVGTAIFGQR